MQRSEPISAIKRSSAREDVLQALRAALISGALKPNEIISAPTLAEAFGVSATPVREAMIELARENMVEVVRNKGFRVLQLSGAELDELVEVRLLLEVPTMGQIAASFQEWMRTELERLLVLAAQVRKAALAGDLVAYIKIDNEFHLGFLALSGNASLVRTVGELRGRSRLYGLEKAAESGHVIATATEHRELVGLALDRDVAGIQQLTARHINRVRTTWATGDEEPGSTR